MFGEKFRKKYALSKAGEANVKKGTFWTVVTNLVVMAGIGILYLLMKSYMATLVDGAALPAALPYLAAVVAFIAISFYSHYNQYHFTYSLVYDEVGYVRTSLAERLRKLPLSFFSHRDLAELTETMMSDVDRLEHVWSHVLGYLYGGYISTAIVAVMVAAYDWRLAIACLWGVPVAFALLFGSRKVFDVYGKRAKAAGLAVADSIQETLEDIREIRATNQETRYLAGVNEKIDTSEQRMTAAELRTGIFVNAASVIMRLGMATTVLVGAHLILTEQIDFMVFFMFLLMVTRIYAPFDQSLALIAEVFVSDVSVQRLNEIFDTPVAVGSDEFLPRGHDVVFDNVGFAYEEEGEATLEGVSFTANEGEVTALVGPSGSGKSTCARLAARLW
ncbi:MAG: ABC transporter ATP-binding protein, partial [Atopobiaceae bacterium]|nr:ABC transporter ATP-binding protein [Atopobiaceae bacterium]